jgi:methyltransferase (TIGR00027 family)
MESEMMLSGIPGTSLWGLKARAQEHQNPDGLFQDALAERWFQKLAPFFSPALARWYTPTLQRSIALRTDILDRAVRMHLQRYPDAVVVEMGAGFSTRYHRLQPEHAAWYEWDLPEMIELRLGLQEPLAPNHHYLAYSLTDNEWMKALSLEGPARYFFIAEGLFMYFPRETVETLLQRMQQHFPGAFIAFDVLGALNFKAAQAPGEDVDAPVYWGVENTETLLDALGLFAADTDLSLPAQIRRYGHYQHYLRFLERWLLSQRWLTRKMGGTLLARF